MSTDPSTPENDTNLSGLGRALLDTGGSKPSSGPWVPPTAEELGKLLPEYDIVKMLGRGGMGAVYMGRQKSLDRAVAIKILSGTLEDSDMGFKERFKNEARAMGKLNFAGIVAVHDFGEAEGGLLYIVMEYVEGTDVARMIAKEGRLHTEHAMAITAHVCDALAYAHERGIIHRDIKPANIMVGYDGVVKVADFGLAKMTHSQNTGLTQSGMAMGTLHYMAPEALMLGSAVDHRADIYAVGVMLYQMLTGKIPQGMFELPSLQVKGLDPRYDGIIAKALREDREARYQSIREMRGDLDNILTQPVAKVEPEISQAPAALPTQVRPQRPGGQPYRPPQSVVQHKPAKKASSAWLVWAALCLLALGGGYWIFNKSASQSGPLSPLSGTKGPAVTNLPTTPAQGIPSGASQVWTTLSAAAATKDAPFVNSLGMKFVPVPITGGPTSGQRVLFSIWETRVQDYEIFVKETKRDWPKPDFMQEPTHPAVNVSWDDATAFCSWLTERERKALKISANESFRLPSDHEWSCAVRIGEREDAQQKPAEKSQTLTEHFPWGHGFPPPDNAGNYAGQEIKRSTASAVSRVGSSSPIIGYEDDHEETAPVGSYTPSELGLFDLGGNAWEWCDDWIDASQRTRVLRGASWAFRVRGRLLSSDRAAKNPAVRDDNHGFRVVLTTNVSATAQGITPSLPATPAEAPDITPPPTAPEFFDGRSLSGWTTHGTAVWRVEQGGITSDSGSGMGTISRSLSSPWFDLTGEVYASADGNGGIHFQITDLVTFKDGLEVQICGSRARGRAVGAGGLFAPKLGKAGQRNGKQALLPDAQFTPFRLVVEEGSIRFWLAGEQVFEAKHTLRPEIRTLAFSRLGPEGKVAYRNLRLTLPGEQATTSAPVPSAFDVQQHPEFRTRVANYQKARHAQLAELTAKYRSALTTEKDTATKSGVLANVTAAEAAIVAASAYAQAIEAQVNATEVKPLPALAAVADPAPPRLKELRDIFVREAAKIETSLITGLDSSLATVQASLVQSDKLIEARAVEDYRKGMMAGFRDAAETVGGTDVVRLSTSSKQQIPADALVFGGTSYYLFKDAMTWQQARAKAETMGGHLATITTAEEDAWVRNTFGPRLAVGQLFLIGASQERSDSPWQWVTGEPWNFTAWYGGAPNNLNLRNKVKQTPPFCLCYYKRDKDLSWNDLSQSQPIARQGGFLVEWESGATSSASSGMPGSSTLATATKDKPFVNSLGMKFVPVPGTKVLMCIHETRKGDYAAYAAANPGVSGEWRENVYKGVVVSPNNDHPVVSISWEEARAFCGWLSRKDGGIHRLPTDEEWSHAVGIAHLENFSVSVQERVNKVTNIWPWGASFPPPDHSGNFGDSSLKAAIPAHEFIQGYNDGHATTAPVMNYKANAIGIHDLGGNVYEFCEDWYSESMDKKIARGGDFNSYRPGWMYSSHRTAIKPASRNSAFGFRVVIELP